MTVRVGEGEEHHHDVIVGVSEWCLGDIEGYTSNPNFNGSTATLAPDLDMSHFSIPPLYHISII